jgi:DNA-binding response OmpR family regulator
MARKKILLIDDEVDIANSIKLGLRRYGCEVDIFNDPARAVSSYSSGKYDLILLDVQMPGMNGFEVYRHLRHLDPDARICFLTAFESYRGDFSKKFPGEEAQCFLQKPMTMSSLMTHINRMTGGDSDGRSQVPA